MANAGWYLSRTGILAGADLSAAQYKIVKFASTAGEVILATAGTENLAGVLQNAPADGEAADVAWLGIAKVQAEASVSANTWVTANSTGRAQETSTANADLLGKLGAASTTAGDIVDIYLAPSNL